MNNGTGRRTPTRDPYRGQTPQRGRNRRIGPGPGPIIGIIVAGLLLVAAVVMTFMALRTPDEPKKQPTVLPVDTGAGESTAAETEPADVPLTYTDITLLSAGDVMYHTPQLTEAYVPETGEYDFSATYQYVRDLVSSADYAVVNFEATTAGDAFEYTGYPCFNAPDTAMSILKEVGFDMLLFANNHCNDTGTIGITRTQENFVKYGFDYIGARPDSAGKTYKLVNVKGVNLGLLNTTDDLSYGSTGAKSINGIPLAEGDVDRIDTFNHSYLDEFYTRAAAAIADLRTQGADIIIYYVHWGDEYHLLHNEIQDAVAHKLCDLGVDVIIGGHPHVVQDSEVLTSTVDPEHKTLCFYSLGNYVSNQNRLTMGDTMNSTYTENGLTVILSIRKYSDGATLVTGVRTVPTWVHRYTDGTTWKNYHVIEPLPAAYESPDAYGLYASGFGVDHAAEAYRMTTEQLGDIVEAFARTVSLPADE
ncbi:MAG: CapA family protein [Clostridia bacterium]|nr:CapA family protein [Clostridia bacterium]